MLRAFGRSRLLRAVAGVLVIGGFVALLVRLFGQVLAGDGLASYANGWGIETTPLTAIVGLAFAALVLGGVELFVWLRGIRRTPVKRRHRARGPI